MHEPAIGGFAFDPASGPSGTVNTCVIHIGAPKTGSTAIQRYLFESRSALAAQGWDYPDISLRGFGHHDLAFALADVSPDWATPGPLARDELMQQAVAVLGAAGRDIVLSSENLYLFPAPDSLRELLERSGVLESHRIRIVAYLRRQDLAHESWYNQAVKAQGFCGTIEDSLGQFDELWDYAARLEPWLNVFDDQDVVLADYDECRVDLVGHFCGVAGLPAPQDASSVAREINTSLNRDLLAFQRAINRLPLSNVEKRRHHKSLMELTRRSAGLGLFDESPLIDAGRRRQILARYEAGNVSLARRCFGRDRLFAAPGGDDADATGSVEGLNEEKILQILYWILSRDAEGVERLEGDPG